MRALARLILAGLIAGVALTGYTAYRIWDQGNRDERPASDAIVVMGAAQYDGRPSPLFRARLDHAIELYHAGIAPWLIVTGGKHRHSVFLPMWTGRNTLCVIKRVTEN